MSKKKNRSGKKRNRAGRKNQLRRLKRTLIDKPADSYSEILEPTHNHIDLEYEELFRSYNPSLNNNIEYSLIAITYQNAIPDVTRAREEDPRRNLYLRRAQILRAWNWLQNNPPAAEIPEQ